MDILKSAFNSLSSKRKAPETQEAPLPVTDRSEVPPNRKVLYSWTAPIRTFTPRSKEYYKRLFSLIFIVGILLIFAGQFLLLALIISLTVLFYVLSSVPPESSKFEIDNYGIFYLGRQYYWQEFKYYFFTEEAKNHILNVDTKEALPGRLIMLLGDADLTKIKELMSQYLPMREDPPENVLDKALKHISTKLSLD